MSPNENDKNGPYIHPFRNMSTQLIRSQLERVGLFSDIRFGADGTSATRQELTVALNAAGHAVLLTCGLDDFWSEVENTVPECKCSGLSWKLMALDNSIWPEQALERPRGTPRVLSHLVDNNGHRLLIEVTSELCWFEGHFPDKPILAGVVQLHWAVLLSKKLFRLTGYPREVAKLKFQQLLIPPRVLEISLYDSPTQQIRFRYTGQGRDYSQGRLNFGGND